jgi:class 3 adenylate cyclase
MPELNGFETLQQIKADAALRHIPIIMITANDEMDSAVHCIESGADDYILKPFNPVLLNARIVASMEKKRLRDLEQNGLRQLQLEREKSERLLLNILPKSIAERMKRGETMIADTFPEATVLLADLDGMQAMTERLPSEQVVALLNDLYSGFDWLLDLRGLLRIKTFGNYYMVAGGVPEALPDHAVAAVDLALEMRRVTKRFNARAGIELRLRFGLGTGPVKAGMVGRKNFFYHLWGDAVNVAMRMQAQCPPDCIVVSHNTAFKLQDNFEVMETGAVEVPGQGSMPAYIVTGKLGKPKGPP